MKIGYIFPGQGSQKLGMGQDLYEKYEEVRKIYQLVKNTTGIDVANLSFNVDEELLGQTDNAQISILTMSLAILELLKENNIEADMSCGLSLGEYSSLIYSGALNKEDGIRVVKNRGEYMQKLAPKGEWLMAAVIGMDEERLNEICKKCSSGFALPVNFNCPGQIVISGEKQAVEEISNTAKENGARKIMFLKTAGPFHTKKLQVASEALYNDLIKIKFHKFETPVVKNIDGKIYKETLDIPKILAEHITHPVRFMESLQTMLDNGVDTFIEIGPGKTLSGFVKRMNTDKKINILNINDVNTFKETIEFLKKEGI